MKSTEELFTERFFGEPKHDSSMALFQKPASGTFILNNELILNVTINNFDTKRTMGEVEAQQQFAHF